VKDTELVARARELYQKHQRAFEFIVQNRPSYAESLHQHLRSVIMNDKTLRLDLQSPHYFRFVSKEWDRIKALNTSQGWDRDGLITIELNTPWAPDRALELYVAINVSRSPRIARAIYVALEGTPLPTGDVVWAKKKRIPIPTEFNEDFEEDVANQLISYVSEELPGITRNIRKAARESDRRVPESKIAR
jgi:hypothetical protein